MTKPLQRLRVSENGRFLVREDGTPFFWLGDTAWELAHRLDREDAKLYLEKRAEQGFTVIQTVALAEFEGATTDNAYGRRPLETDANGLPDPARPDTRGEYSYWAHLDYIVDTAAALELYVALLPTWGDKFNRMWGKGPEIFTPDNAGTYGKWLGSRYRERPNIVWVLGGDRPLLTRRHFAVIEGMAAGLAEGDGGSHLISFHPKGAESSSHHLHEESWLDFNMIQSGHGEAEIDNYKRVQADYERLPVKPTLDAEPCYEDIPVGFDPARGYFDEADVRRAAYYAVLSGAFGHTYGHHSVWSMCEGKYASADMAEPGPFFIMGWKEALDRPGARQMRHLRTLLESRNLLELVPDQGLVARNWPGSNYMAAARGADYALIYCPNGLYVEAVMGRIAGERARVSWYCPREGVYRPVGERPNAGTQRFDAPSSGRGNDWILVMEGVRHV